MNEINPYASPVDTQRGKYDHRLFWRIVKAVGALVLAFAVIDAFAYMSWTQHPAYHNSPGGVVQFITGFEWEQVKESVSKFIP